MLLELTFTWPETAILIAVTVVLSLLGRLLLGYAIRKVVAAAISRARVHADSTKHADRLWAQATGMANERFRQRAETLGLFGIAEVIANLSTHVRLEAGDLIFTGTPAGVSTVSRGDLLEAVVAGVGELTVRLV